MAWIESHQTLWRHPKTQKAARLAGVSLHEMIGLLHCLWWWSLDYADDGNLDAVDPADVEAAVGWQGEDGQLWGAWVAAGFIDDSDPPTVHDWHEYAGRLLEKRASSRERAQTSRERARSVHPYNQPTKPNQPTNPQALSATRTPSNGKDGATERDDFSLVELAHGQYVGKKIFANQAKAYEDWLRITTPQAIIDALRFASEQGARSPFAYAMTILQGKRDERTLPRPAHPLPMTVIDDMPTEGPSWT